jgi:hypothetical protein
LANIKVSISYVTRRCDGLRLPNPIWFYKIMSLLPEVPSCKQGPSW